VVNFPFGGKPACHHTGLRHVHIRKGPPKHQRQQKKLKTDGENSMKTNLPLQNHDEMHVTTISLLKSAMIIPGEFSHVML
jgi:hypothetical protein